MGTAQYLSPEQAQGKATTPRSDIYSIGVILYEALTGRVPFEGDSAVAVALKQVSEAPSRPSAINPDVPPALDAVVMRALAKDPERRFKDADAFLKALDAAERAPDQPRPRGHRRVYAAVAPGARRTDLAARTRGVRGESGAGAAGAGSCSPCWSRRSPPRRLALTRPEQVTVPDVIGQQVGPRPRSARRRGLRRRRPRSCPAPRRATRWSSRTRSRRTGEEGRRGLHGHARAVSSGPAIVAVPTSPGLTESDADQAAREPGLQGRPPSSSSRRHVARGPGDRHRRRRRQQLEGGSDGEAAGLARRQHGRGADVVGLRTKQARARAAATPARRDIVAARLDEPAGQGDRRRTRPRASR